jgi:hypothetical protein
VCDGGRGVWREAGALSLWDDDDRAPAATVGGKPWDSPSDRHRVNTAARWPFLRAVFTGGHNSKYRPAERPGRGGGKAHAARVTAWGERGDGARFYPKNWRARTKILDLAVSNSKSNWFRIQSGA